MPDLQKRILGAQYYVKALRTGESSAAKMLEPFVAADATSSLGGQNFDGRSAVVGRVTGIWPNTSVSRKGGWGDPFEEGGNLVVVAEYPTTITGGRVTKVTFEYNDRDEISKMSHEWVVAPPAETLHEVPLVVRGIINGALQNDTALVVSYVTEDGKPSLSLRGSLQFLGGTQIAGWLRHKEGGMARSLKKNPDISLLYRDSPSRTTLLIKGLARFEEDEETRRKVWDFAPEVEQNHTPNRQGACLVIDVLEIKGGTPMGAIDVQLVGH